MTVRCQILNLSLFQCHWILLVLGFDQVIILGGNSTIRRKTDLWKVIKKTGTIWSSSLVWYARNNPGELVLWAECRSEGWSCMKKKCTLWFHSLSHRHTIYDMNTTTTYDLCQCVCVYTYTLIFCSWRKISLICLLTHWLNRCHFWFFFFCKLWFWSLTRFWSKPDSQVSFHLRIFSREEKRIQNVDVFKWIDLCYTVIIHHSLS